MHGLAVPGLMSVYVFCSAGVFVVGDICGSGRPQQEQANPLLPAASGVSLSCESIHLSVHLLERTNEGLKPVFKT